MRPSSSLHALALAAGLGLASPFAVQAQVPPDPVGAVKDQASGVTGSGQSMVLHVRGADGKDRVLRLGQVYEDGWALSALSASAASFTRQGMTRQVGLNPSGAIATATPLAPPSTVIIAGGLSDIVQRYSGVVSVGGRAALKLGNGPDAPVLAVGDKLTDGWTLYRVGWEMLFERNGDFQAVGFDAQRRPMILQPGQAFAGDGTPAQALTPPTFPADLMEMPDDQRLALYNRAVALLDAEAQARYGHGNAAWDIQAAIGLNDYMDMEALRSGTRQTNIVSRTLVTNPDTGQTRGVLTVSVDPATGRESRLMSIGANIDASTLGAALQIRSP